MVFVYFAFWGLQEEFSTLPCSPYFLHNFGCCYIIAGSAPDAAMILGLFSQK
jgi:hypothetical protein